MRTALLIVDMQRSLLEDETWQPERVHQVTLVEDAHSTFERDYLSAEKVIEHHNRILDGFAAGSWRMVVRPPERIEFS